MRISGDYGTGTVRVVMSYAHTLQFACPDCHRKVAVTRLSDYYNLEDVQREQFQFACSSCRKTFDLPGYFAETHSVTESATDAP
jgi:hypothetical protein